MVEVCSYLREDGETKDGKGVLLLTFFVPANVGSSDISKILSIGDGVRLLSHSCPMLLLTEANSINTIRWAQGSDPKPWRLGDIVNETRI